ncbi:MAG: DUF3365 domain-containing protein [Gammaproteobacteria bacterium]
MPKKRHLVNACCLLILTITINTALADEMGELARKSRELIKLYSESLQAEYEKAAHQNNPEDARKVCKIFSKKIATKLSKDGWYIKRTSLKPKNPDNTPDQFEKKILQDFEIKKSAGWPIDELAYYKLTEVGNQSEFRYIKAIAFEELCLSCHDNNSGDTLSGTDEFNLDELTDKSEQVYILGVYSLRRQETKKYFIKKKQNDLDQPLPEYKEIND